jgi:hypothetical protein
VARDPEASLEAVPRLIVAGLFAMDAEAGLFVVTGAAVVAIGASLGAAAGRSMGARASRLSDPINTP